MLLWDASWPDSVCRGRGKRTVVLMPVCCVLPTACCLEAALKPFPGFRQELFDKLYDFFHRYFSPSGSIYFQHTPAHKNIYEKVYTDDRDVVLFWKTHMLYYVKTDRLPDSKDLTFAAPLM
jgi:hypothetical protein